MNRTTLHLAVYLFDRFVSLTDLRIGRDDLQVIGITCLRIASKAEEIMPPDMRSFVEITDNLCTGTIISRWELCILMTLRWHLHYATPVFWTGLYSHCGKLTRPKADVDEHAINGLLDVCVLASSSLRFTASVLAATALLIAVGDELFVQELTGYDRRHLDACYRWMLFLHEGIPCLVNFSTDSDTPWEVIDSSFAANTANLEYMKVRLSWTRITIPYVRA